MSSPFTSPEVKALARELASLRRQVAALAAGQGVAPGGMIALDGTSFIVKDREGVVRQVIGAQGDGTVTTNDINAPAPPQPVDPVVTPIPGGFKVAWSGAFAGGVARPTDLAFVELHVDLDPGFEPTNLTRDAALTDRGTIPFTTADYIPHTVRLVAVNTSKARSVASGAVTVTPLQLGPGDVAPGGIGTVNLDDGAVTPSKSGTGVTSNLVPDPGFNDAGWRVKRTVAPWGFVDAASVGFSGADWAAFCPATTARATLSATGSGDIPVIPNDVYFVAYDAARSASGAGKFWLEVTYYDSAGAMLSLGTDSDGIDPLLDEIRDIGPLPTSEFETRHGQVTVPPSAASMRVAMVRDDEVGTSTGTLYIDRLEIRSVVTRSTTGERVETSPSGILVFDTAGNPIGSINADGTIAMVSGTFDTSITYQGTELADLLDQRARGEIARVDAGTANSPASTTEVEWLQLDWTALPGRAYKLRSSGLVAINAGDHGLQVRWTTDGFRPLLTSPVFAVNHTAQNQTLFLASDLGWTDSETRDVKMLFCVKSWDATSSVYWQPADFATGFSVWVEDVGPRRAPVGGVVTPPTTPIGGGGTAPDPEPVLQTFTKSYNCAWSQSWVAGNKRRSDDAHRMWQGYISGANVYGDQVGIFGFDMGTIRANLAGATINKVEVYLRAQHWYYNSGGNVWLGTTPAATPPGSFPATTTQRFSWHLGKPEGRWVNLGGVGITIGNEIRDGSTGAFVLDPRPFPRNLLDYGYFEGAGGGPGSTAPGLRITYTKAV